MAKKNMDKSDVKTMFYNLVFNLKTLKADTDNVFHELETIHGVGVISE